MGYLVDDGDSDRSMPFKVVDTRTAPRIPRIHTGRYKNQRRPCRGRLWVEG